MKTFSSGLVSVLLGLIVIGCGAVELTDVTPARIPIDNRYIPDPPPRIAVDEFREAAIAGDSFEIGITVRKPLGVNRPILSAESPGSILRRNLVRGLKAVGIEVVPASEADVVLEGTVHRFWVVEHAQFGPPRSVAKVDFDVTARDRSGGVAWTGRLEGRGDWTNSWFDYGSKSVGPTLETAIGESVVGLLRDPEFWRAVPTAR